MDLFNWTFISIFDLFRIDTYFAFHLADTYTNNFMTFQTIPYQKQLQLISPFYQFYTYMDGLVQERT